MAEKYMLIDNIPVGIDGEKNILEVIRKAGIDLPTFCYYSELSTYGACRMCVIEHDWGGIEAACSTVPYDGMVIYTNTPRLRKYRKAILELLLSNHCRDCTACAKNNDCKLQDLASRFGIKQVRFKNEYVQIENDESSLCVSRDQSKCILCGDCVRMCKEVQNVGAIDFVYRGSELRVSTAFDEPLAETACVGCGQCAAVCPTGALMVKNDTSRLWDILGDKNIRTVVQIAPAVRVGISKSFGIKSGENSIGKVVAALRRLGFDEVYDTSTGADFTVLEEAKELVSKVEAGNNLPLFTSCCPAWVQFVEKNHPDYLSKISTCKSPMQMFGSIISEYHKNTPEQVYHVAVMPCSAKKYEIDREEFKKDGKKIIDCIITTQELIQMIKEAGIVFDELDPEGVDRPFGTSSGAGMIFGVTGGVTEAVIRRLSDDKSMVALKQIAFSGVRGLEGVKEAIVPYKDRELKIAVVSGLKNADDLVKKVKLGEKQYDFIEVMACPSGCIGGAGQPFVKTSSRNKKIKGLYEADRMNDIKRSEENPVVVSVYGELLKGKVHEMLHVDYCGKE